MKRLVQVLRLTSVAMLLAIACMGFLHQGMGSADAQVLEGGNEDPGSGGPCGDTGCQGSGQFCMEKENTLCYDDYSAC